MSDPRPPADVPAAGPALGAQLRADAAGVAAGALAGAAQGAVVGGAAGAAAGAGKGLLLSLSKSKVGAAAIAALALVLVGGQLVMTMQIASAVALIAETMGATDERTATISAVASGLDEADIVAARDLVQGTSVPWEIAAAVRKDTGADLDVRATLVALDEHDPGSRYRALSSGAAYSSDTSARTISDTEAAAKTEQVWQATLNDVLAQGEELSEGIYKQALTWHLGQSFGSCGGELGGNGGDGSATALDEEQLGNATTILAVAKGAFPDASSQRQAAIIGVVTAMQESSLRNIDFGDRDSVGLFQQRPSAGWGTVEQIMNPVYASTRFYSALSEVAGWQSMAVGDAAQTVQVSAFPDEYAKWENTARVTVAQLFADTDPIAPDADGGAIAEPGDDAISGSVLCVGGNLIVSGDTVAPVVNYVVFDRYGPRVSPVPGASTNHRGIDMAWPGCESSPPVLEPIYAAQGGVVTFAAPRGTYGNLIEIDHGNGFSTRYAHLQSGTTQVKVGDIVEVGEAIAAMGTTGASSGCHVHFETLINGKQENPEAVMLRLGVIL